MKKLVSALILVILFVSNSYADEIFAGYSDDNKEKYITWNMFDVLKAEIDLGSKHGATKISKLAMRCLDDDVWQDAELLEVNKKHGMRIYKFKFHWIMNSKILYIDVDGNRMSCRG